MDEDGKEIPRGLFGGRRDFVKLHEVWLKQAYRGRGFDRAFFDDFNEEGRL